MSQNYFKLYNINIYFKLSNLKLKNIFCITLNAILYGTVNNI